MTISIVFVTTLGQKASAEDRPLLLEVVINGMPSGKIGEFVWRNKQLFVEPAELHDIGLRAPNSVDIAPGSLIPLASISGLTWRLDQPRQSLSLSIDNELLLPEILHAQISDGNAVPVESGTGATLNYDVIGNWTDGHASATGTFDIRAFSPYGVLSSGALVNPFIPLGGVSAQDRFVRLDSTYVFAAPSQMLTYRAGDFINNGLSWTRPVRLGGAEITSDFTLRPDLVTMPLPSVSGAVSVPTTLDILANGNRIFSSQVQPGAFDVPQLPVVSGANTITVALTNALGQQVAEQLPFYGGANLLSPGLQS